MSHLNALRGNFARQIIKELNAAKRSKKINQLLLGRVNSSSQSFVNRNFSTKTASVADGGILNSTWEEITIGNEILTDYVFQESAKYPEAHAVVSPFLYTLK